MPQPTVDQFLSLIQSSESQVTPDEENIYPALDPLDVSTREADSDSVDIAVDQDEDSGPEFVLPEVEGDDARPLYAPFETGASSPLEQPNIPVMGSPQVGTAGAPLPEGVADLQQMGVPVMAVPPGNHPMPRFPDPPSLGMRGLESAVASLPNRVETAGMFGGDPAGSTPDFREQFNEVVGDRLAVMQAEAMFAAEAAIDESMHRADRANLV